MPAATADQPAPVRGHATTSNAAEVGGTRAAATMGAAPGPRGEPKTTEKKRFNGSGGSAVVSNEGIVALTLTPVTALRTGKKHSAPSSDPITIAH